MKAEDFVSDVLTHHGVKGMKWGVHKTGEGAHETTTTSRLARKSSNVTVTQKPGQFVKTVGGKRQTASNDAVRVAAARQFAKKSTTDVLSTKQLQDAVQRMNLEIQYSKLLKQQDRRGRGKRFIQDLFGGNKNTNQKTVQNNGNTQAVGKLIKTALA